MKHIFLTITFSCFLFSMSLLDIDAQRAGINEGQMSMKVTSISSKNRKIVKTYNLFKKSKDSSLVVFTHSKEKGTVVLKQKNNLYIKTPNARRHIRITPMQKLLGNASIGDILEIYFNDKYEIKSIKDNVYTLLALNNKDSYAKILVYVSDGKLVKSELFSFSGKKLKTLFYTYNKKTNLIDKYTIQTKRTKTIVDISYYKNMKLPNKIFKLHNIKNAYYLTRKYLK